MQALSSASIGWGWSVVVYLNAVTTQGWSGSPVEGGRGKHCSKQPVCMFIGCKGGHLTVCNLQHIHSYFVGDKSLLFSLFAPTSFKFSTYVIFTMCSS